MENRFFTNSKDDFKTSINECTILIFGERHTDVHTIKFIKSLSEYLRQTMSDDDSITYALEYPKSETREEYEQALRLSARILTDSYNESLTEINLIEETINECKNLLAINDDQDDDITIQLNAIITSSETELEEKKN